MKITCCCGATLECAPDLYLLSNFTAAHSKCLDKKQTDISSLIRFSTQGAGWGVTRNPSGDLVYFEDVQKLLGEPK